MTEMASSTRPFDRITDLRSTLIQCAGSSAGAVDGILIRKMVGVMGLDDMPPRRLAWRLRHAFDEEATVRPWFKLVDPTVPDVGVRFGLPTVDGRIRPGLIQFLGYGAWSWFGSHWIEPVNWHPVMQGALTLIDDIIAGRDRLSVSIRIVEGRGWRDRAARHWAAYLREIEDAAHLLIRHETAHEDVFAAAAARAHERVSRASFVIEKVVTEYERAAIDKQADPPDMAPLARALDQIG